MNQLKVLIKIMMFQDWGINGFSNKIEESMEKRKLKSILMMIVFMMCLCCYLILTYSILLRNKLEDSNCQDVLFKLSNIIVSVAIFLLAMYKADNGFFNVNNNSMLRTLPISPKSIIAAKIISILIASYILIILCVIPSIYIYYFYNPSRVITFYLISLVCIIITPFLPMALGIMVGMIIKYFKISNEKKGRILISIVSILLLFMMVSSMKVDNMLRVIINKGAAIVNNIALYYRAAQYFADAISKFKLIALIKYILINSASLTLVSKIIISNYNKITEIYDKRNKITS
mgnify:FL=1